MKENRERQEREEMTPTVPKVSSPVSPGLDNSPGLESRASGKDGLDSPAFKASKTLAGGNMNTPLSKKKGILRAKTGVKLNVDD